MKIQRLTKVLLLLSIAVLSAFGYNISVGQKSDQNQKIIKTVRPEVVLGYVTYERMIELSDAIFIGKTDTDLRHSKSIVIYNKYNSIEDYFAKRKIKVLKILKNNGKISIRKGKITEILEQAVIFNYQSSLTRLIQEDYEEILSKNKYVFFIYQTNDNRYKNRLSNGKFSKYNLEKVEKDEDIKKKEWKARVLKDYSKEIKEK